MSHRKSFLNADVEEPGIPTPANPGSGTYKVYLKTDGNLYTLNSSGNETRLLDTDDDALYVHKTGDESVGGIKSFTSDAKFAKGLSNSAYVTLTELTGGPPSYTNYTIADGREGNAFYLNMTLDNLQFSINSFETKYAFYSLYVKNESGSSKNLVFTPDYFFPNLPTATAKTFAIPTGERRFYLVVTNKENTFVFPNYIQDIDAVNIANGSVSNTEFQYLDGVTSAIQTQLNAKEVTTNKSTNTALGNSDTLFPSQNAVKTYVDNHSIPASQVTTSQTGETVQDELDTINTNIAGTLRVINIAFNFANPYFITTDSIPAGSRVYNTRVDITSAFDVNTTLEVSLPGVSHTLVSSSQTDPTVVEETEIKSNYRLTTASALRVDVSLPTGADQGVGIATVFYAAPIENVAVPYDIEILMVAGGGPGGGKEAAGRIGSGGGGAGRVLDVAAKTVTPYSTYAISIGAGASGTTEQGSNGSPTTFAVTEYSAPGGGAGGYQKSSSSVGATGTNGGSGGGGAGDGLGTPHAGGTAVAGTGETGFGNDGGAGSYTGSQYGGGGGGGANATGSAGSGSGGGNGGDGKNTWSAWFTAITSGGGATYGVSGYIGGGGGGGVYQSGTGGTGGAGGGASAPNSAANGNNGTANTGGGGSGASGDTAARTGGNGGSGLLILKYSGAAVGTGGSEIITYGGYTYHIFTGAGTFTA